MILGIESSCDESALAVFDPSHGLKAELVFSQITTHQEYGGIVPDLASRGHLEAFGPLLDRLKAETNLDELTRVAVTTGPGLASCLALGLALGRSLSLVLGIPLAGVNHLRGHVFSPFIPVHGHKPDYFENAYETLLPHLGLIVSGGNTLLVEIDRNRRVQVLGETIDDAAGEALDKGAKLLGMEYPGGPLIEKAAKNGDPTRFDFPRGMVQSSEVKFSFSGLKTSLRYRLEKMTDEELARDLSDLCASYQQAVIESLIIKTKSALRSRRFKSLGLSGGVANNQILRQSLTKTASKFEIPCLIANPEHTGDNAGMIAFAAFADDLGTIGNNEGLSINPNWMINSGKTR